MTSEKDYQWKAVTGEIIMEYTHKVYVKYSEGYSNKEYAYKAKRRYLANEQAIVDSPYSGLTFVTIVKCEDMKNDDLWGDKYKPVIERNELDNYEKMKTYNSRVAERDKKLRTLDGLYDRAGKLSGEVAELNMWIRDNMPDKTD